MKCVSHHLTCLSLNGYSSQVNPNRKRKRKRQNLRFNFGLCSFQSKSFASQRSYPCSPHTVFVPLRFIFTDEAALRWLRGRHWPRTRRRLFERRKLRRKKGKNRVTT